MAFNSSEIWVEFAEPVRFKLFLGIASAQREGRPCTNLEHSAASLGTKRRDRGKPER